MAVDEGVQDRKPVVGAGHVAVAHKTRTRLPDCLASGGRVDRHARQIHPSRGVPRLAQQFRLDPAHLRCLRGPRNRTPFFLEEYEVVLRLPLRWHQGIVSLTVSRPLQQVFRRGRPAGCGGKLSCMQPPAYAAEEAVRRGGEGSHYHGVDGAQGAHRQTVGRIYGPEAAEAAETARLAP